MAGGSSHEILNDTMELGPLVTKTKIFAILVLASRKRAEVFSGFGDGLERLGQETQTRLKQKAHPAEQTHDDYKTDKHISCLVKVYILRPRFSSPCLMSKKTLWVTLGPFAASTDCAQNKAVKETTMNAIESLPNMTGWNKDRVQTWNLILRRGDLDQKGGNFPCGPRTRLINPQIEI